MPSGTQGALDSDSPSAVGLTRLSRQFLFPPGGELLYRDILRLVELDADDEFLVVPCGRGAGAMFLAHATGAGGAGADPDAEVVAAATRRAKRHGVADRVHFEHAPLHDLPYQDEVFDLALAEIELGAAAEPLKAVRELVRVTRPGGSIVLVQMVWLRDLDPPRREELVERLGLRPLLLVEWRQMLREAGIVDLVVEDWSDTREDRPSVLGGLARLFTLRGKLKLLPRAWRRWGWRGVRAVLSREQELRRLLVDDRVLGVSLLKGTRRDNDDNGEDG